MAQKTTPTSRIKLWLGGTLFEYLLSALIATLLLLLLAPLWVLIGFGLEDFSPTDMAFAWSLLSLTVFLLRDQHRQD